MVLQDRYGRQIGNLRVSVTDRCNLRCTYCMPDTDIEWSKDILHSDEIIRLIKLFYDEDVKKLRLTGGEPLLREEIVEIISEIRNTCPDIEISMTTNAVKLHKMARELKNAGLDRLNISLDTLNEDKFNAITKRQHYSKVIKGIESALENNIHTKINAVSIKNFNDDEKSLTEFIEFSNKTGIEIRFIELMPFTGNEWNGSNYISSQKLREKISKMYALRKLAVPPSSTSQSFITSNNAKLGFISSVSESFCNTCNRVRITADGAFRACLHNQNEVSLRDAIRAGKDDIELIKIIKLALNKKWKEHPDFLSLHYLPPISDREMIRIGG